MYKKVCKACGKLKYLSEFHKDGGTKDGYRAKCKECIKEYNKKWYERDKNEINKKNSKYYLDNHEQICKRRRDNRRKNPEKYREWNRRDYLKHKEKRLKTVTLYRGNNLDKIRNHFYKKALYNSYADQISWCEDVRKDPNNTAYLQVRCTYCNEWFNPTNTQVKCRSQAINDKIKTGNYRFYCSSDCENNCCLFQQIKYPKGKKPNGVRDGIYKWKQNILNRDNYKCRMCKVEEKLRAHHLFNYLKYSIVRLFPSNGITLCKECHSEFHKIYGRENNTIYQFFKFRRLYEKNNNNIE